MAIVHDYLNQFGGAERVVLAMSALWPDAPIHTSLYRPGSVYPEFRARDVRTSWVDRLPVDERFRALAPVLPSAMRSLGVLRNDLVVSSSSGWAHGVRTAPGSTHVVYCYTPARWLYPRLTGGERPHPAAALPLRALRRWDLGKARLPDGYIAISRLVADRIAAVYGRRSDVVYPPVDTSAFTPSPPGTRLLLVSRLLPYKRVDVAMAAAQAAGVGLDIVGTGPLLEPLRAVAPKGVVLHGRVDDATLLELFASCRAAILPGQEDFGLLPLEANASGKPVIALAAGGALETVVDGRTGFLCPEPTADAFAACIRRLDDLDADPAVYARQAERFSAEAFGRELTAAIDRIRDRRDAPHTSRHGRGGTGAGGPR
ncbi:glycosyltransferase [Patulibacter sp.]|uniref:glycosyltransferase n=1 Tax=Patulibacter sp. TaxID=1912859 RepID=UPI002723E978|nr:glycosyltransferase [Patulibacter sp.]MDO9407670.1 glycosyltransferase [Patulibacter sp.]